MAKKIYDIIPPKEESIKTEKIEKVEEDSGVIPVKFAKEEPIIQPLAQEAIFASAPTKHKKIEKSVTKHSETEKTKKGKIKFLWKTWAISFVCIAIFIMCIYFYFSLQQVDVAIWPKTDVLSFDGKITADKSVTAVDLSSNTIPAQIFEVNEDLWQDFPSTGTASNSGKASGTIKIYNKLNPVQPFVLKSGTHFLSDSGKYFVTSKMVTIPAATFKSGKLVAGSVSVQVTAEEAGKDSNIDASKFSIPKLAGTNYYYAIYADSSLPMSGGYSGQVKKVIDTDLANAKDVLSKKVLDIAMSNIKKKVPQDYVLFDNAISNNVTEAFSPIKPGAIVDNFNYQVKVKATALAFKRLDIEKFAKDKISSNLSNKKLLDSSFKIDFNPDSVDINYGKMTLSSNFSARIYKPIDTGELIPILQQKNKEEIKGILESRLSDQLQKEEINFWPFWTTSAPADSDKIKLELKFE